MTHLLQNPETEKGKLEIVSLKKRMAEEDKRMTKLRKEASEHQTKIEKLQAEKDALAKGQSSCLLHLDSDAAPVSLCTADASRADCSYLERWADIGGHFTSQQTSSSALAGAETCTLPA